MNSLKHLGIPIVSIGTIDAPDEVLRWRDGDHLRAVYLRDDRIVGAQLVGDIGAAGIYHSLILRRQPVGRFGARLVEPGFGMADLAFDAVGYAGHLAPA